MLSSSSSSTSSSDDDVDDDDANNDDGDGGNDDVEDGDGGSDDGGDGDGGDVLSSTTSSYISIKSVILVFLLVIWWDGPASSLGRLKQSLIFIK